MKRVVFPVLLFASAAATAQAQDPQEGAKWAANVCGECHAIARSQPRSPNGRAQTFVELANTPGMTAAALNVALTTPHAENADVRLYPRTAARNQRLHSEPEGQ